MDYEKKYKDANDKVAARFGTNVAKEIFTDLYESEDERIRKEIINYFAKGKEYLSLCSVGKDNILAWLEKQGEQKPTQEIEPFEAEHGKYYYCIKDYFCGGRKQASKGDVVQALRGLPIMGLKDASEYFLPVNFIKCNSAWSKEDEEMCQETIDWFEKKCFPYALESENPARESIKWLKSLKNRVLPQPKQEWNEDDKRILNALITSLINERFAGRLEFLKGIKVSSVIDWLKSLKQRIKKEAV